MSLLDALAAVGRSTGILFILITVTYFVEVIPSSSECGIGMK
jgi:hypothetical protein